MTWVDIIVAVILFLSLIAGAIEGAVKHFFRLVALLVVIPVTGVLYTILANVISFLPGAWAGFVAFFVIFGVLTGILALVLLIPGKVVQIVWREGILFRLLGGVLNLVGTAIGLVVFTLVLRAYPTFDWLRDAVFDAATLQWLVLHLVFVQDLLPQVFRLPPGVFTSVLHWR